MMSQGSHDHQKVRSNESLMYAFWDVGRARLFLLDFRHCRPFRFLSQFDLCFEVVGSHTLNFRNWFGRTFT